MSLPQDENSQAGGSRTHRHRRVIELDGYERDDGLWDIEARLTDTKSYYVDNHDRGGIPEGEPLHEMTLTLTLDDDFNIKDIAARTLHAPYHGCPNANPVYKELLGIQIKPGWMSKARNRMNKMDACTHLTELLQSIGTAAYQTLLPLRKEDVIKATPKAGDSQPSSPPALINQCYGYREDGPVIKRNWPHYYTGKGEK